MLFFGRRKKNANQVSPEATPLVNGEDPAQKNCFHFYGTVLSDVGCVRTNNEDNYILGKYMNSNSSDYSEASIPLSNDAGVWQFAGVFDGMGGGEMGELASRDTAVIFGEAFAQLGNSPTKAEVDLCLRKAFLDANNKIVDLQQQYNVFGTTGTVLCSNGVEFKIYHLGDSRAYQFRNHELLQLTKDQTLAQMKIEVGMYKEGDPAAEADKHKLIEYIGRDFTRENLKPFESRWIPIEAGDSILLCSDGLYDMCTDAEISEILQSNESIKNMATSLVEKARNHGGDDNVTCLLVAFSR